MLLNQLALDELGEFGREPPDAPAPSGSDGSGRLTMTGEEVG